jgi:carbamoyl-phosphate synthase large subunit
MKKINLLLTGCGCPGTFGTVYALRNNQDGRKFRIVGTDVQPNRVGKYIVDRFYRVPLAVDPEYINFISTICKVEHIDLILPQTTAEVQVLAGMDKVICSPSVQIANDKYLLYKEAEKAKVPIPKYRLISDRKELFNAVFDFGYPDKKVVVKPRVSCGGRGLKIIDSTYWNKENYLNEKPDPYRTSFYDFSTIFKEDIMPELLISEYLPGKEYTIDCFRGKNGFVSIVRERKEIRSGISFDNKVIYSRYFRGLCGKLAEKLNLLYCFGFQFKGNDEGTPVLLECNPRVQGTMVVSMFAGFNVIYNAVKEALGEEVKTKFQIKEVEFKRYWGGIAIENGKIMGKI